MSVAGVGSSGLTVGLTTAQRQVKLQAQAKTQKELVSAANKDADTDSQSLTSPIDKPKTTPSIDLNG
jgi:hypothetical protein